MVCCDKCGLWVHTKCDGMGDESHGFLSIEGSKYFCGVCREASKSKEMIDFKKRMRWFSRNAKKRSRKESSKIASAPVLQDAMVGAAGGSAALKDTPTDDLTQKLIPAGLGAGDATSGPPQPTDPPNAAFGVVDKLVGGKLPMLRVLPTEAELRAWTLDSQTQFWHQRRRQWEKERLCICQKACQDRQQSAAGSKAQLVNGCRGVQSFCCDIS